MPYDNAPETPWLIARRENTVRLEGFKSAAIDSGDLGRIRRAAEHVRRQLAQLSEWAASEDESPCPSHLYGLTAFELADAADALEAAGSDQAREAA